MELLFSHIGAGIGWVAALQTVTGLKDVVHSANNATTVPGSFSS